MKKISLLHFILIIVIALSGCGGGGGALGLPGGSWGTGDSTVPVVNGSNKTVEVNGTFSAPAAPAGGPSYAADLFGGKYSIAVIDKDNPAVEAGIVSAGASSFKAAIPAAAVNRYAMIVLTDIKSKKVLYRNILGKVPKVSEFPTNVNKIILKGITLNETSTARALFAIEKGVSNIAITSFSTSEVQSDGTVTKDYTSSKTDFDMAAENIAGGAANISQMANAVQTVVAVLTSSGVNDSTKSAIAPDQINSATSLLTAFANSVKNPSAQTVITAAGLASSVKIGDSTINSNATPATITSAVNTITPIAAAAAPVFQPAGGSYDQDVNLIITTATQGAIIRYTLDGSTPSATAGNIYSGPVTLSNTTTVKAVAVKSGYSDSPVATAVYTLPNKAAAPVISPGSATYTTAQTVTIVTSTVGATIKFTTDGSIPSETNGLVYTGAFTVSATANIKAVAIKAGIINSNIVSASFVINTEKAATPVFSPAGGTYSTAQSVNLTTSTNGAIIKYTTDGSTPSSSNGLTYSSAISVNATTTIKAVATKTNMADSEVATAAYTIQEAVSAPIFNPPAGSYNGTQSVSIISGTGGATIFYTLNGSEPTILSTQYNSAISITSNTTLKAIAVKSGMTASSVSTAAYTILQKAAAPSFDPVAGSYSGTQSVSITSLTANASIYYTLDNSTPTTSSTLYNNSPVSISSTGILKAIAVKSGMTNSDVSMAAYTISFPPVADPQFSVASGTYNQNQSVTLSCATEGASIYYTLDGATPTSASSLYTSAISIASTAIIKAIAIKAGMANSNINAASYVIDKQAPSFTIDYYSDSALTLSLGTNPRLSAGTYYLKITASKTLQSAPTISISAEGTANDNTNAATTAVSGNDYKYTRVIAYDALAIGAVIEDISISATDAAGNAASNISPTNEAAKAAYTDTVAPVATLTYSPSTAVKQGATLVINAVISESLMNTPSLKIAISDANTLAATDMTRTDATHYTYSHAVGAGNGNATAALSNAKDLAGNAITAAPVNPTFAVDNTAPTAPTAVTITPAGGTVKANTINLTNTNMTAQATITAAEATGGSAQLLIDNVVKAHDTTIAAGDTTVAFDLGKTSAAELQATIPVALNGKTVTVKLIDAAGNETTSAVANPTITVDYTAPTAPTSVTVTPAGGTVVANTLNSTNTNMTAAATITANQAVGGKAQLLIDGVVKAEDAAIAADETAVAFTLGQTTANGLQTAVPATLNGKTVTVKVIDAAGNETTSAVANPTITVDYTAPTGSLSYVPSASPAPGTSLSIIAAFSEPLADSPVIQIAISGQNTLSATNMSKTSTTSYAYIHTVANGSGAANVTFSTGTDAAGNPVTAAPTAGASFTVTNTVIPAGVYKKAAALANINDATISGNTLTIKTAGFDAVYDVTGNATVISIMGQLPAGNTFTIDSTGKVSAIDASLATGTPSIALTASQCAAGINVKGFSNAALTLTGSAASQAININITGGTVDVSNANLTGTLTMNTAAAATITSGAKTVTVGALAAANAVSISGTAGGTVPLDAAATNVTINGIKVVPSVTTTVSITDANTISVAGGAATYTLDATAAAAPKTFNFSTAQTGPITALSSAGQELAITAAAASSANITVTGGKVNVSDANLDGNITATTAASIITAGTNNLTLSVTGVEIVSAGTVDAGALNLTVSNAAGTVTLTRAGNITKTGAGTLALNLSAGNAGTISVTGSPAISITNTTAGNATARTVGDITLATGALTVTAGAGTNNITIGNTLGATAGTVTIIGGAASVAIGNLATTGTLAVTNGAGLITAGSAAGSVTVTDETGGGGTVNLGAITGALGITSANKAPITVALGANNVTGLTTIAGSTAAGNKVTLTGTGTGATTITGGHADVSGRSNSAVTIAATASTTVAAGTKDLTISSLAAASNTIATTGALTISADLANSFTLGAAPSGITANGSATADANANPLTVSNVATGKTLTLSNGGAAAALIISATTGTGSVKLANAVTAITANGTSTLDINNLNTTIIDVTAGTLTLTNSGDGTAGAITVNKAGTINGAIATIADIKTFLSLTVTAGTTLTAFTTGAGSTVSTLTNNGTISTLTNNGTITTLNGSGTYAALTLGTAGAISTALTDTMTISNVVQTGIAANRSIDLGSYAKAVAVTGPDSAGANSLTLTSGAGAATINVKGGFVNLGGVLTGDTLNIDAAANTKVNATGNTLTSVKGSHTIEIAGAANATIDAAVNTLNITGAVTAALNIGKAAQAAGFTVGALDVQADVAALNIEGAAGQKTTVTNLRVGKDDQAANITVALLDLKAYSAIGSGISVIGNAVYDVNKIAQITLLDMQANADPIPLLTVGSTGGGKLLQTGATHTLSFTANAAPVIVLGAKGTFGTSGTPGFAKIQTANAASTISAMNGAEIHATFIGVSLFNMINPNNLTKTDAPNASTLTGAVNANTSILPGAVNATSAATGTVANL